MWGLRQCLVASAATLLISSCALSAPTETEQKHLVTRIASNTRFLRAAYTFDIADGTNGHENTEERGPLNLGPLTLSKFTSKLTGTKSLSTQVKELGEKGGSLDDFKRLLNIKDLDDVSHVMSPNYKYYNDFMTAKVQRCLKENCSLKQVRDELGIAADVIKKNIYYDDFVEKKIKILLTSGKDPVDIWTQMGLSLNNLKEKDIVHRLEFEFYKTFIDLYLKKSAINMVPENVVFEKMGIKEMTGYAKTLNMQWHNKYAANVWLKENLSSYDVWKKMGLGAIKNPTKLKSDGYQTYVVYAEKLDQAIAKAKLQGEPAPVTFSQEASEAEMMARAHIWAETGKNVNFVDFAVKIGNLSKEKQTKLQLYFQESQKAKREPLANVS